MLYGEQGKTINLYISEVKLEKGSFATDFTLSPDDADEAIRTVQTQLAGSWAVKNLNNAGNVVSEINAHSGWGTFSRQDNTTRRRGVDECCLCKKCCNRKLKSWRRKDWQVVS